MGVPKGARELARRAGWNVIDQILSALTNVALSLLVAKTVSKDAFGAFSIAFLVFSLLIAFNRAAVGQPLTIRFSRSNRDQLRAEARSALGAALVVGTTGGAGTLAAGLAVGGETGRALIAVGVCMPALLLQDTCRLVFFSAARADRAAFNDLVWSVLELSGLAVLLFSGVARVEVAVLIWGGSATLAALFGLWQLGHTAHVGSGPAWAWRQRSLSGFLVAEYALGLGAAQVGILFVGLIGSASGVGSLRAVQVLLGPLGILGTATFMFAIPEVARRPQLTARQRALTAGSLSAVMGAATVAYIIIMLLIPTGLGQALLGDTWRGARSVLLPISLMSLASALGSGPAAVIYGLGHARVSFQINIVKAPLLLAAIAGGVHVSGTKGAAWGMACVEMAILPLWCLSFHRLRFTAAAPDGRAAADADLSRDITTLEPG